MKKWQSFTNAGLMVLTFGQQAMAQQGVTIKDGQDVTQGAKADAACANSTAICSIIALAKALYSGITSPIPGQSSTTSIGGVGILQGGNPLTLANPIFVQNASATFTTSLGGVGMLVNTNNASAVLHVCGTYTTISMAIASTLQLVAGAAGSTIYVCDFDISVNGVSTTNISMQIGTGTQCGSNTHQLGQSWYAGLNWAKIAANPYYRGLSSNAVASASLCVKSTVTSTIDFGLYYDQY